MRECQRRSIYSKNHLEFSVRIFDSQDQKNTNKQTVILKILKGKCQGKTYFGIVSDLPSTQGAHPKYLLDWLLLVSRTFLCGNPDTDVWVDTAACWVLWEVDSHSNWCLGSWLESFLGERTKDGQREKLVCTADSTKASGHPLGSFQDGLALPIPVLFLEGPFKSGTDQWLTWAAPFPYPRADNLTWGEDWLGR